FDRPARLAGGLHRAVGVLGAGAVALVAGAELRAAGNEQGLVGYVGGETRLAQDRAVAVLLEPERQVLAAALDDPALGKDVDVVGGDVVEQSLAVRDQQ